MPHEGRKTRQTCRGTDGLPFSLSLASLVHPSPHHQPHTVEEVPLPNKSLQGNGRARGADQIAQSRTKSQKSWVWGFRSGLAERKTQLLNSLFAFFHGTTFIQVLKLRMLRRGWGGDRVRKRYIKNCKLQAPKGRLGKRCDPRTQALVPQSIGEHGLCAHRGVCFI